MNEINGKFLFALWLPLMLFFIMFLCVCVCFLLSFTSMCIVHFQLTANAHENFHCFFFIFTCLYLFTLSFSHFLSFSAIFNILCHLHFPIHSFPVVKTKMLFFHVFVFLSLSLESAHSTPNSSLYDVCYASK